MRITVPDVLGYLAGGMTEDEILRAFPYLTLDDIRASRLRQIASPCASRTNGTNAAASCCQSARQREV